MHTARITSYAKINLTLEIVGESNGFHLLDSLVANIDVSDRIVLKKRKDKLSSVTMHGLGSENIPPEKNNALKAAEAFCEQFGVNGADITVYKNIPIGAGLGGSSADIAGVLRGMAHLYDVDDTAAISELAERLGSDCKYMLTGGFQRMEGKGEQLTPLGISPTLHFLMLVPNASVSAGACYQEYDKSPMVMHTQNTSACIAAFARNDLNEGGRYLTNDLFEPAARLCEQVKTAYEEALSFSPLGVVMTGSGSAVLALFETKELCEWAKSRYRGKCKTYVVKTVEQTEREKSIFRNPFVLSGEECDK